MTGDPAQVFFVLSQSTSYNLCRVELEQKSQKLSLGLFPCVFYLEMSGKVLLKLQDFDKIPSEGSPSCFRSFPRGVATAEESTLGNWEREKPQV